MTTIQSTHPIRHIREVPLEQLKPHPRNYRTHPDDEITHLIESIRANGIYRNVVVARDWTILAGHGVVEAARRLGISSIPVYQTEYDPDEPRALKLLVGDNEISHLTMNDDRVLTELLRELNESDLTLLGTGYDEMMLANLVMVSRPASEIADLDAAAQWVGMPEHDMGEDRIQIIVNFANEEDRKEFCRLLGIESSKIATEGVGKSIWWPKQVRDDVASIHFKGDKDE